jgi:hypothetical protein
MANLYTGGTVPCIAFVSPDHRLIEDGLPPSERYLDLLRTGRCLTCGRPPCSCNLLAPPETDAACLHRQTKRKQGVTFALDVSNVVGRGTEGRCVL